MGIAGIAMLAGVLAVLVLPPLPTDYGWLLAGRLFSVPRWLWRPARFLIFAVIDCRRAGWVCCCGCPCSCTSRPLYRWVDSILGGFNLALLDVGQGLSTVVRTAQHMLVYDPGPAFSDSDAGQLVVIPWLRSRALGVQDLTIVSHVDNDHAHACAVCVPLGPQCRFYPVRRYGLLAPGAACAVRTGIGTAYILKFCHLT